jgi:hypothetical protein
LISKKYLYSLRQLIHSKWKRRLWKAGLTPTIASVSHPFSQLPSTKLKSK